MRKIILLSLFIIVFVAGHGCGASEETPPAPKAGGEEGCAPKYAALADHALVRFNGTGDMDITIVTDPLCWHCRLGHKLLGEYPGLYRTVRLVFFPRRSFIGSDMAAWVLEDRAGSDDLQQLLDFAYTDLKQPKVENVDEARMLVLAQFVAVFPHLLKDTTLPELFVRLQTERDPHLLEGAALARAADLPGTPVLIAGKRILMGYGPDSWVKALEMKEMCE